MARDGLSSLVMSQDTVLILRMKMTQVKMDPLKSQEMEMTWEVEMEAPMLREFGLQTLNKVFKKLLPFILPVEEGRSFCRTKGRCMVSG